MFKLGEVKVPCDQDFEEVKKLTTDDTDWTVEYSKNNIKAWTKRNDLSSFKMIKVRVEFDDIPASLLYNVIQDSEYRSHWDDRMIEGFEICYISPCSDIGYYSMKSPKPFKNRDFVTQRSWLDYGEQGDKIAYNHSVNHSKYPAKKGLVRGISFLTGIYIKYLTPKSCVMNYVTQSDPGGSLPSWLVNMAAKTIAPKLVKKIYKACLKYDKWKAKHNPDYRPWVNPEQIKVPRIDWNDIVAMDLALLNANLVDESNINENDIDKNDLEDNE